MDDDRSEPIHAPPPRSPRASFGAVAVAALGFVATLGAAALAAAAGIFLTVFGLGGVVLFSAAAIVFAAATIWRRGILPLAVIALALALPSAWAAHADQRLDRSSGSLIVAPRTPADLTDATYRRGVGPVLIDLRGFSAPPGSTTRIAAQADAGRLVVALPRGRCFNLDVRFEGHALTDASSLALRAARAVTGSSVTDFSAVSGLGLTARASQIDSLRTGRAALDAGEGSTRSPYNLLAFNRWPSEAGRYRRAAAGQPAAPTLRLDLRSAQQIVVRDYPANVGPLNVDQFSEGPHSQVSGMLWPEGLQAPLGPQEVSWSGRSVLRTAQNRARWIAWEERLIEWAKAQAQRAAGPCASTEDVSARGFSFLTQPAVVRDGTDTDRLLGTGRHRRSAIPQRPVDAPDAMLQVEVDGLGRTRLVGTQAGAGSGEVPVSP